MKLNKVSNYISYTPILSMKNQNSTKETRSKNSSREDSRKSSVVLANNFLKKIAQSIPLAMPSKSIFLNSHRGSRPKVDPIKIPIQSQNISSNHTRYSPNNPERPASIARPVWPTQAAHRSRTAPERAKRCPNARIKSIIVVTPPSPRNPTGI